MLNVLKMVSYVPLFLVVGILYVILVMIGVNFGNPDPLFSVLLPSEAEWTLTGSDIFIMISVVTLFVETIKATKTGDQNTVENMLSMFVFLGLLMTFLFWNSAGTTPFLLMTLMSLIDVIAGFTIGTAIARRDFSMTGS